MHLFYAFTIIYIWFMFQCAFVFMKGLKKENTNFSILGPKNAEKRLEIFLHLYKYMAYYEVWFSRSTFHEKANTNLQGVLFYQYRSKTPILAKIYIF